MAKHYFEHGSHILEEKHGPRVWTLRRAFDEHRSRIASEKCESQPFIHRLQNRLQLQSLQLVINEHDAFVDVQHSS